MYGKGTFKTFGCIEELNKILERAVNLKNFLKGKERIQQVAEFVAKHYRENVEPQDRGRSGKGARQIGAFGSQNRALAK